ncbi:nucleotidyltransferase [Halonatronum saccharophilum]|uniref:nucleotidyltransferase n=1 Tax=Halonatronum saccharophilum TaxID=150060 RepID=UPI00047F6796|nr:nucleotidyltransferase [Halonatronum saccharophilum]
MKVLGIITEYNPFHNGHKIHLEESIKASKADSVICIMSGAFLQRGEPSIVNQWARTKMALEAGVDLMIQLPISYSLRSAEHFAFGSIKLLNSTGIVDNICFGSELGDILPFVELGRILSKEPLALSNLIQSKLNKGLSYPEARSKALIDYIRLTPNNLKTTLNTAENILKNPNNILGLEYIKALNKLDSSITPLTIKREGEGYHSLKLNKVSSASAIRSQIYNNYLKERPLINEETSKGLLQESIKILEEEISKGFGPIFYNNFSQQILTLIRRMDERDLKEFEDIRGGLENRIKEAAQRASSLQELISLIKTKRFTQTRIQRILSQVLLNIKEPDLKKFDKANGPLYFRVLGFNNKGRELLKSIKEKGDLPIITKVANHLRSTQDPRNLLQKMLSYDLRANNIYSLAYPNLEARKANIDFRKHPIIK